MSVQFVDDSLAHYEYFQPGTYSHITPELRLMYSILEMALLDIQEGGKCDVCKRKERPVKNGHYLDARGRKRSHARKRHVEEPPCTCPLPWVMEEPASEATYPFTFSAICTQLGINIEAARKEIATWVKK